ncbi:MAG: hypothetical protein R3C11_03610 [Planctomycetaceae bacterium]
MSLAVATPASSRSKTRIHFRVWLGLLLWTTGIAYALLVMWEYEMTPGEQTTAPANWPVQTGITFDHSRPNLLLFAHPRCPCTRATLEELSKLVTQCQDGVAVEVWFYVPENSTRDWLQTDLWESAMAIPGVEVQADINGVEAKRFHARTSGSAVLYDSNGSLLFQGGITASRGHVGDNSGRSAIQELILTGQSEKSDSFVYGCPINNGNDKFEVNAN